MLIQTGSFAESAGDHPLLAKLQTHGPLPPADCELLGRMLTDVRSFNPRQDIIREGDRPNFVHLMIDGWSCRYTLVADGQRQITAFLVPGDFCDVHIAMLDRMDHGICAAGSAKVAFISRDLMNEVAARPALTRALQWANQVDEGVLRAWIANMGRRDAFDRVAHLMCELHARLTNVGLVRSGRFDMPLTQEGLGDALGLTAVHVNRVLRLLRERGLMTFARRSVTIIDLAALRRVAGFDPGYLHLVSQPTGDGDCRADRGMSRVGF